MIKHFCANCREETVHEVKDSDIKSMSGYKEITCSECGSKGLVPEGVLSSETSQEVEVDNVSVDEQRQIDDGCESGVCPSR